MYIIALYLFQIYALAGVAHALPYNITYPIIGASRYSDDFNSPRSDGPHNATDVFANKMQPIVSPVDGVISFLPYPQPSYGYMISIRDSQNYRFNFVHINNDSPNTDDGNAKGVFVFAPDMKVGNIVVKGQHIAYVGDSGNAEGTAPHLHFEIVRPDGSAENPYGSLYWANKIETPSQYPKLANEVLPYGPGINVSVRIAIGNFGMSNDQYVTAAGPGGGPQVLVFKADDFPVHTFFAYDQSFKGGVDVAAGDIDGDGVDEIITGTGPNSGSHVRIFKPNGDVVSAFFAYPGYSTGVNVAAGDVDGDGVDEIITGTGPGWGTHVKVFEVDGTLKNAFFAYPGNSIGVDVAVGNVDGAGADEIVTSAGPGGGSHILVFGEDGISKSGFFAYNGFHGGVRVSVGDVRTNTTEEEILTAPYTDGGPDIRLFNMSGVVVAQKSILEPWWSGGYDPAAGPGKSLVGTGENRRTTLRTGF